jgi:hypothetical protein
MFSVFVLQLGSRPYEVGWQLAPVGVLGAALDRYPLAAFPCVGCVASPLA